MSQIKQYTSYSKLNDDSCGYLVLHADHLAAMAAASAYDEEKERALFEAAMTAEGFDVHLEPDFAGVYIGPVVHTMWQGWKRCAKARAKAAGCL